MDKREHGERLMQTVWDSVNYQIFSGKGHERHGSAAPLLEQPWMRLANVHGNGFLTGQAAKKIEEATANRGRWTEEQWEREILGAIAYLGFALLHGSSLVKKRDCS